MKKLRSDRLFCDYLRVYEESGPLSDQDEIRLCGAAQGGDRNAKDRMVRSNLALVIKIAGDFKGRGVELEDLVGEGIIGLIRAVEKFDPSFGARFGTYAVHWIRQAMGSATHDSGKTIRIPQHVARKLTVWRRSKREFRERFGRNPNFDELADYIGLNESHRGLVRDALQSYKVVPGGIKSVPEDDPLMEIQDAGEPQDLAAERSDEWGDLISRIDRLPDLERTALSCRYGIGEYGPMTYKQIGARIGTSREYARDIEVRALDKIRKSYEESALAC